MRMANKLTGTAADREMYLAGKRQNDRPLMSSVCALTRRHLAFTCYTEGARRFGHDVCRNLSSAAQRRVVEAAEAAGLMKAIGAKPIIAEFDRREHRYYIDGEMARELADSAAIVMMKQQPLIQCDRRPLHQVNLVKRPSLFSS